MVHVEHSAVAVDPGLPVCQGEGGGTGQQQEKEQKMRVKEREDSFTGLPDDGQILQNILLTIFTKESRLRTVQCRKFSANTLCFYSIVVALVELVPFFGLLIRELGTVEVRGTAKAEKSQQKKN